LDTTPLYEETGAPSKFSGLSTHQFIGIFEFKILHPHEV
jgi:hypothetical protein